MPKPTLTRRPLAERLPPWGVGVFESHHAPDFVMGWRRHPFLKVIYVLGGAGELHFDKESAAFASRDLLLVPPGIRNRLVDQTGRPASLYVLCIARGLLRFDPGVEGRLAAGLQRRDDELADRARSLFRRLLFQQSHGGQNASIAMATAALELVHRLLDNPSEPDHSRPAEPDREAMARYLEWLESHFYEATTLDAAAAGLGMSRRHFSRVFREATGSSWLAYVHERAVTHAARLLAETPAPIASVAFECGFADLSTFYRRFKARHGVTPAQWRSGARSGG